MIDATTSARTAWLYAKATTRYSYFYCHSTKIKFSTIDDNLAVPYIPCHRACYLPCCMSAPMQGAKPALLSDTASRDAG